MSLPAFKKHGSNPADGWTEWTGETWPTIWPPATIDILQRNGRIKTVESDRMDLSRWQWSKGYWFTDNVIGWRMHRKGADT
jgi:hypothetical protein